MSKETDTGQGQTEVDAGEEWEFLKVDGDYEWWFVTRGEMVTVVKRWVPAW